MASPGRETSTELHAHAATEFGRRCGPWRHTDQLPVSTAWKWRGEICDGAAAFADPAHWRLSAGARRRFDGFSVHDSREHCSDEKAGDTPECGRHVPAA